MTQIINITHANCPDGFTSAVIVANRYGDAVTTYHASYGGDTPDVTGKDVIITDFSYDVEPMMDIAKKCKSLLWIDHHQTSIERFDTKLLVTLGELCNDFKYVLDQGYCGAYLTWVELHPKTPVPMFVKYINDNDLYQHKLPNSKLFSLAIRSYPKEIDIWSNFLHNDNVDELVKEGVAFMRKHKLDLASYATQAFPISLKSFKIPCVNCPNDLISDLLHNLSINKPFAMAFSIMPDNVVCSLRSNDDGEDVAAIAESFGGGGHKHAAGFKLTYQQFNNLILN